MADFSALAERHRRELHVHCYRMLGSFDEAEDAVQEALLRAWRARENARGDAMRAWLYRIATNVCLDVIAGKGRVRSLRSFAEVPWLQPYPDVLLDEVDAVVRREDIELAFLAVIQLLPARQRAVVIARDVLEWSAAETAELLDTTVVAVNSALQRAHVTLRQGWETRGTAPPADEERELLRRFVDAHEREDVAEMLALVRDDVRITMPPLAEVYLGVASLSPLFERAFGSRRMGDWHLVATSANRQPAAASWVRRPGDTEFRAMKLDVFRMQDGAIAEITTFGNGLFGAFGLPETL